MNNLNGWVYDPAGIKAYAAKVGSISTYGLHVTEQKDVSLWLPLMELMPGWKRGKQGIGDCVSWGGELAETQLMSIQAKTGASEWIAEAATEPNYGGSRVEVYNKKSGGYQDGATGYGMAQWALKYGVLLRIDYSKETGNPEHDLRVYSANKAKEWGNYGCGGANDKGKLDSVAKKYPVAGVAEVKSIQELISALCNGYPCTIASMAGYGDMVRNSDGIVRMSGQWAHQMMFGGLRWLNNKPLFRLFQSWGNSCGTNNDPGIIHPEISKCSWWVTESDANWMIQNGECWAFADVQGFPPRKLDFITAAKTWG